MTWLAWIINLLILLVGLFLILLILIQRGKGGGLAGAFGGAGGSSAFGSRAGDTFTKITITIAGVWVLLIMLLVKIAMGSSDKQQPVIEPNMPSDEDLVQRHIPTYRA